MKIYAIQNDVLDTKCIGYLFYYEKMKEFYIEILDNLDEWDVPLLLDSLYRRGIRSIDSYISKMWVSNRIIPPDRQNMGEILRVNKLSMYDEYDFLMMASGRCEQDDYYLKQITFDELPKEIKERFEIRVENVSIIDEQTILVSFRNGLIKTYNMLETYNKDKRFRVIRNNKDYYNFVRVMTDGFGVYWDWDLYIPYNILYANGKLLPISVNNFLKIIKEEVLSTADVMKELYCTRQYVNALVKKDKLHPIKSSENSTLFLKDEVIKLKWN